MGSAAVPHGRHAYVAYGKQKYAEYLDEVHYAPDKNEFWPVPYNQLYYVPKLYTQNKNYND